MSPNVHCRWMSLNVSFRCNVAKLSLNVAKCLFSFPMSLSCPWMYLFLFLVVDDVAVCRQMSLFDFCGVAEYLDLLLLVVCVCRCLCVSLHLSFWILFVCVRCRCMSLHVSFWVVCFAGNLKLPLIMWCRAFADVSVCPWMFFVACWVLLGVSICSVWLV